MQIVSVPFADKSQVLVGVLISIKVSVLTLTTLNMFVKNSSFLNFFEKNNSIQGVNCGPPFMAPDQQKT